MFNQSPDEPPQLESAINSEDYLDGMSAPRIDPTRPDMSGWAMKLRRKKRRPKSVVNNNATAVGGESDVDADLEFESGGEN
jgi:sulfite reductase (NADPH) hemoprotein beta-component